MNNAVTIDEKLVKKTRKDHKCCECGCVIPKGQPCMAVRGLWEDGPATYRWCLLCEIVRQEVLPLVDDLGEFCYGELYQFVRDLR